MYTLDEVANMTTHCKTTLEVQKVQDLLLEYFETDFPFLFKTWLRFEVKNRKRQILTA